MPDTNIAEPMDDNEALRSLLAEMRDLNDRLLGRYESLHCTGSQPVTDSIPAVRAPRANAVKTLVTNHGANTVLIFEDMKRVSTLPAGETWVSPLAGSFEIKCFCSAGQTSSVTITTYLL